MARLDRLGWAKELAQLAAVLGRNFSLPLLESAWRDPTSVEQGLATLVHGGVVQPAHEAGEAVYAFKHALLQETAYRSLVKATRQVWHARIVQVIEEHFPERLDSEPEQLARHSEEGGLYRKAIDYYQKAGAQTAHRSASRETIQHLSKGIELLERIPEGIERSERELMLQVELGNTLVATSGWASAPAIQAFEKARAACELVGEPPELFHAVRGLIAFYVGRAELKTARGLIEDLEKIAERSDESSWRLLAHEHFGIVNYFEGKHEEALQHFEQGLALYDREKHQHLTAEYGEDIGTLTRTWLAWTLWTVGRPGRAFSLAYEAIDIAKESAHPFSLAYAYLWTSLIYVMNREPKPAGELAERALEVAEPGGYAFLLAASKLIVVWTKIHTDLDAEAMQAAAQEFSECIAEVATTGNMANGPMQLAHLAEAFRRSGQIDSALINLDMGLAMSAATGQCQWDSELYRIKGEILLKDRNDLEQFKQSEQLFYLALVCATNQGARSLQLRAALSLAHLWSDAAPELARALVEPIYREFNEESETPDLTKARELLGGL